VEETQEGGGEGEGTGEVTGQAATSSTPLTCSLPACSTSPCSSSISMALPVARAGSVAVVLGPPPICRPYPPRFRWFTPVFSGG
jgi:hypothetical protein